MGFCEQCGQSVEHDAMFCSACGTRKQLVIASLPGQARTVMNMQSPHDAQRMLVNVSSGFCHACGLVIDSRAEICPRCGVRQGFAVGTKSRITAALLAVFLGGFGAHKFYLGRPVQGLIYLLFCWTAIPALIAFVEFIIYLCASDSSFAAKYG